MPTCSMLRAAAAVAVVSALFAPSLRAQPTLSINGASVTEGNAGTVPAVVTVTLTPASSGVVTVTFESQSATPAATGGAACGGGVDFVTPSGTVRFDPGVVSQTISVTVCGDTADEPDEKFRVRIARPVGATIATSQGAVTITDDDAPAQPAPLPTLSISNGTQVEGNAGATNSAFPVSLSSPSSEPVTFIFRAEPTTATQGTACGPNTDYVQLSPPVTQTISPGAQTVTVSVPICGDTVDELDETFRVVIANPIGATLGDFEGVGTIINDDEPALGIVSISDGTVIEGAGLTSVLFFFSVPSLRSRNIQFAFRTEPITATPGETSDCGQPNIDYEQRAPIPFTISPGGPALHFVSVPICGDAVDEANETFRAVISDPVGVTLGDFEGVGTIIDDDAPAIPTVSIVDMTQIEGSGGSTSSEFIVSLSSPSTQPVTITFRTEPITATQGTPGTCPSNIDYTDDFDPNTKTINPGAQEVRFGLFLCGDTVDEPLETFRGVISNPIGATLGNSVALGRIADDDDPAPPPAPPTRTLAITPQVTVAEPRVGAQAFALFTVTSGGPPAAVSVQFATAAGTARAGLANCLAGADYLSRSGTLTFSPVIRTRQIVVPICSDTATEGPETFTVTLSNPVNAAITAATGTATIQ